VTKTKNETYPIIETKIHPTIDIETEIEIEINITKVKKKILSQTWHLNMILWHKILPQLFNRH
jgi:hypothetical protein